MSGATDVLIVDDRQDSRAAMRWELTGGEMAVVGETGPGPEAINLARELHPDVILVSVEEPLVRAWKTIEGLTSALPNSPVVAISSLGGREQLRRAMHAGARDFVPRPWQRGELREALQMVVKQEEKRRLLRPGVGAEPVAQGSIITVFGIKGGTGKTTLALNLAISLALAHQKVALIDLDGQQGAAAVMLDLAPKKTLADLSANLSQMDGELLRGYVTPHSTDLHLLAAPAAGPEEEEEVDAQTMRRVLDMVASSYEYVVVDAPARSGAAARAALQASTYILLVTSLEVAAVCATKRYLESMKSWEFAGDKIKLVLSAANTANSIVQADVEQVLGLPIFWHIPYDPHVSKAGQLGVPLLLHDPHSRAARAIADMHYALTGLQLPRQNRGGWRLPFVRDRR